MAIQFDEQEFLTRIYDKIDKIDSNLTELRVTSAKQEENIRTHIYRTELNEQNVELLRKQLETSLKKVDDKLDPILKKENQIVGMLKLGGILGGFVTIVGTIFGIVYKIL